MHIAIVAVGSRGDIQPYLALGLGLQQQGHDVRIVSNVNFEPLVKAYSLPFTAVEVDSFRFVQDPRAQAWLNARDPLRLALNSYRAVNPSLMQITRDTWRACRDADAIIYHTFTFPTGYYLGKHLGVPALPGSMYPLPTRAHEALPLNLPFSLPGPLNYLSHLLVDQFTWLVYRSSARNVWDGQSKIGFAHPYHRWVAEKIPILCCYSPAILPVPPDYPDNAHVTGYWFLPPPPDWQPHPSLVRFVEDGDPPLYIGFGSMGGRSEATEITTLITESLGSTGQRAVLAAGWSGMGERVPLPANIFPLQSAPHAWIFPRMAAIIHHGGVGTTGAGLRAGVPNIVVPHFADQYFWGQRVAALGAGPEPLPRHSLTAQKLTQAIEEALTSNAIQARARSVGERMRDENGVASAIRLIERFLSFPPSL